MTHGIYIILAASAALLASCAPQPTDVNALPRGMLSNATVGAGVPCERIAPRYQSSVKGCETMVLSSGAVMSRDALIDLNMKFRQEVQAVVTFDFDKSALRPDARAILDRQAEWIKRYPNLRFSVFGHTDLVGSLDYNFGLAARRADATTAYLLSRGVAPGQVEAIVSFGKSQPIVDTPRREERNRRTVTEVAGYLRARAVSIEPISCSYIDTSFIPSYSQCYLNAPRPVVVPPVPPVVPPPQNVDITYEAVTQAGQASITVGPDGTVTRQASGTTGPTSAPTTSTDAMSVESPNGGTKSVSSSATNNSGTVSASITDNGDGTETVSVGSFSTTRAKQ